MTVAQLDITGVVEALRNMPLPDGLRACELILDYDDTTEQAIAHVALILNFTEWDAAVAEACERARATAWDALQPFDVIPNLLFRTETEHASLRASEPAWTPIVDGNC